jgi:hypothetical protein
MSHNILLIGPYFGNAKHGAEPGIYDALRQLGHSVTVIDHRMGKVLQENGSTITLEPETFKTFLHTHKIANTDVVLCPGAGLPEEFLESNLWESIQGTKILWNSEPIRLENYRDKVKCQKHHFDFHFTFDQSEIPLYNMLEINAKWLPQAYNPNWYYPLPTMENSFPEHLVFIGSIGGKWAHRALFLERVKRHCPRVNVSTVFNAPKVNVIYNGHRAILNLGLYCPDCGPPEKLKSFGLQQRVFEAIGAGKVCITNETWANDLSYLGLQDLEHGKHVLFYNCNNLETTIDVIFNNDRLKYMEEEICKIRDEHTYRKRMEQMFKEIS